MKKPLYITSRKCRVVGVIIVLAGFVGACAPPDRDKNDVFFNSCLADLTNLEHLAFAPTGYMRMDSSYDRTGGNEDGHIFKGCKEGTTRVLADLKGPGCVRRIWLTGMPLEQKLDFYFDGESKPRLTRSAGEFRGLGKIPYVPPLCEEPGNAAICYLPIPYSRSLVVRSTMGEKCDFFFYQINYESLPKETRLSSYYPGLYEKHAARLSEIAAAWERNQSNNSFSCDVNTGEAVCIKSGEKAVVLQKSGPAVFEEFVVAPAFGSTISAVHRNTMLRDLVLNIYWEDSSAPSVRVPLGDFFCNGIRSRSFNALPISVEKDVFTCRFPMPFRSMARVEIENRSSVNIGVKAESKVKSLPQWDPEMNYFHATWNQSSASGVPYEILNCTGKGHYAGCYLVSIGTDGSWNIFEGDECIYRDDDVLPSLHGTGLEDYFNGGWYYCYGIFTTPFAGALERRGIRSSQYRFHVPDPIKFDRSLRVNIEFGHANTARGYMSSVAYWYASTPMAARSIIPSVEQMTPQDPLERTSMMCDVFERERISRLDEALQLCREYSEKYPGTQEAELMDLRAVAYREAIAGYDSVKEEYNRFEKHGTNDQVRIQAGLLNWFHLSETNAIVVAHVNGAYRLYLDGKLIIQGDSPIQVDAVPVTLSAGKHELYAEVQSVRQGPWFSMFLRSHGTNLWTDSTWMVTYAEGNGAGSAGKSGWVNCDPAGPFPQMAWFQFMPNAFVFAQYKRQSLGHPKGWQPGQRLCFRKQFEIK